MDDVRTDQLLVESPHAMWVYDDITLRFLTANAAATRRYGFTLEEFLELTILDIRPREAAAAVLAEINPNPEQAHTMSGRWQHLLKDGTTVFVEVASRPVWYRGRPAKLVWTQDMTKTQPAHARLEASEERRRSLFDIASVGISTADLAGNLTDVNAAFVELTAYQRDELLQMCLEDLFTTASLERMAANFETKVIDGVQATTYELELRRGDGTTAPIEVTTQVLFEGEVAVGTLAVSRDISYRKRLEEQLRQSQKLEAVGQLAGGIAHDFNNMLTAITGYAELLAASFAEDDPRADDIAQVRKAAAHAAALTRQLLAFSRKQVLLPQRLDVNAVVRDLQSMLARTLGADVELRTSLAETLAPVETDADQLAQVVLNFALNGRDAMPTGGRLTITTSDVQLEAGPFVAVEVTDTGTGMDEETRSRAFEPFFTTKDTGKGTGLGLATAYGFVNQSGGQIEIDTTLGGGSTFRMLLPAAA